MPSSPSSPVYPHVSENPWHACTILEKETINNTDRWKDDMRAQRLSPVWLCDPMDCGPPGSSVHGILQARRLEWAAISSSKGSSWPRDQTWISCIAGRFWAVWEAETERERDMLNMLGLLDVLDMEDQGPQTHWMRDCILTRSLSDSHTD